MVLRRGGKGKGTGASPLGLVLVTGPTGSGKTTTLYTAIEAINTTGQNILTIGDPVAYQLARINQVQVRDAIGLSFARILRSVLRQILM
jgi:type II secretory ATPase GspE/PulE/Tfp pilus assembly ATPase PilB-like protein